MSELETVPVLVWEGPRSLSGDALVDEREPARYDAPIAAPDFGLTDALTPDQKQTLAEDVRTHRQYAFDVPESARPVVVNVHPNDSYHDPTAWGRPIEGGLTYSPGDDYDPFTTELWGRVMFWVQRPEAV